VAEEPSNELTRPPDDQDLVSLARELDRLDARCIVIGSVAVNRLGFHIESHSWREQDAADRRFLEGLGRGQS